MLVVYGFLFCRSLPALFRPTRIINVNNIVYSQVGLFSLYSVISVCYGKSSSYNSVFIPLLPIAVSEAICFQVVRSSVRACVMRPITRPTQSYKLMAKEAVDAR